MFEAPQDSFDKPAGDFASLKRDLEVRLADMKRVREPYLQKWKNTADLLMPHKSGSINDTANRDRSRDANTPYISDEMPTLALRRLSAGMLGGITSPIKPWFKYSTGFKSNVASNVKVWLEEFEQVIQLVLHRSNFYKSSLAFYNDLEIFGTGVTLMYEDYEDVVRFYNIDAGQYFLATDERGEITVLYREFMMTIHALVREYGINNVSDEVAEAYRKKQRLQDEVVVYQAIQRNSDFNAGALGRKGDEYIDVHWEKCQRPNDKPLRYKGFKEKPFCAAPWHDVSNQVYGISPSEEIVSCIRELYHLKERMGQGIDKAYHGAVVLDKSLEKSGAALLPGGLMFGKLDNGLLSQPVYANPADPQRLMPFIESAYKRIEKAYFGDLFMMLANLEGIQPRTQLEIVERKGEKIVMLSPVLQNIQNDYLKPVLNRVAKIVLRSGLVSPPPEELQGTELQIEYISDLAVAQKAVATSGIEQFMAWTGNMMQVFPELRYKVNAFKAMDAYANSLSIGADIVRSNDEAAEQTNEEKQKIAQQQAIEQGLALTQGAKNLSGINVGGGQEAAAMSLGGF